MREKVIEQKLVSAVRRSGGIAPKLVSPGFDGMPDRMVLMPGGHIAFVEIIVLRKSEWFLNLFLKESKFKATAP